MARRGLRFVWLVPLLALGANLVVPVPAEELALSRSSSLQVLARDGTLLREFVARDGEGHAAPARVEGLPPHLVQAFVDAEDGRFWLHPGVDPLALLRALAVDLRRGRFAQGGSTLAQQLARLLRPHPRTLAGKLGESLLALRLVRTLGRRGVLEQYLTRVPLGNDVRGVEAAARLYFDRPAASLTVAQAALLASLPRSPSAHDPLRAHGDAPGAEAPLRRALSRVLERMVARGHLTRAQADEALGAPLGLARERFLRAFEAPHFVDLVARSVAPDDAVQVRTTLDLALQRRVEQAAREEVAQLAEKRATSAAVIVLDNASGEVLAWVGSPDWFDEEALGRIDGVRTLRQPGSTLKPLAYGAAIDRRLLTPATLLSDVESHFATQSGDYVPKNYDRRSHGPVRARVALGSSYNVPAVRVAEKLGAQRLLEVLRAAGLRSLTRDAEHYGLGLVLGDGEVQLAELAQAYAGLARGGVALPSLRFLLDARSATSAALEPPPQPPGRRFLGSEAAALIGDILSDAGARAPAFGLDNALRFPFAVAAKTGTSRAYTDNWTVGFTRERTVAVWVGNMSGATMRHVSGITGAGPLFHRVMMLAMEGLEPGAGLLDDRRLEEETICALSGEVAGPHCPSTARERFVHGTRPRHTCTMHGAEGVDLGPRFYDWAARQGMATQVAAQAGGSRALLEFPADGDEFLRDRDLPDRYQTIPVRALAPRGGGPLFLELDGGAREQLLAPYSTRVPATPGRHELRLFRPGSEEPDARVHFSVRG